MTVRAQRIAAVRRFNRFYTRQIGVLQEGLLRSPFSLTEARVLYELAQRPGATATDVGRELGLDAGYLSRIVRGFEQRGFLERRASQADSRQIELSLTDEGRAVFSELDARSSADVGRLLDRLPEGGQARLLGAMETITGLLDAAPAAAPDYLLRAHQPGDLGWIVHRHGLLYAREYGWDERFEALVAEIAAAFLQHFDARWEHCWIAERAGERVGSVLLVRQTDEVAKLRLLLVEPSERGHGLGRRLVAECIGFARQCGYRTVRLWTNSNLVAARRLYVDAGFRLTESEAHHSFGHDLVGETWELTL